MNVNTKLADSLPLKQKQKNGLERLGIETVGELLYHFPTRYTHQQTQTTIDNLEPDMDVVVSGTVADLQTKKSHKQGIPMATGTLKDETGAIDLVWFHQPYIAEMLESGQSVLITGSVSVNRNDLQITNPEYKKIPESADDVFGSGGDEVEFLLPVYPESEGLSSRWIYHTIRKLLRDNDLQKSLQDPLPEHLRSQLNLPDIKKALVWVHTPKKQKHANIARKRFAFEEVFAVQIVKKQQKKKQLTQDTFPIMAEYNDLTNFLDQFDFTPTGAQKQAIKSILADFREDSAMSRLLEGDVGSGKTFVAAATAYAAVTTPPKGREYGHLQTAYMAPTEILAKQQFQSFVDYFAHLPIEMALITGSGCKKFPSKIDDTKATDISRTQLLRWIEDGVVSVVFGTHSLLEEDIQFSNLAYVIIDEQHRFGVNQRKQLVKKDGPMPHFLSMTATPIPRTLALTIYGNLDLSVIDELPPGRKTAQTEVVAESERERVYEHLADILAAGQQGYIVCPRIDAPDPDKENQLDVTSVEKTHEKLQKRFEQYTTKKLHGQMSDADKAETMEAFADGKIDILVATSVIEVGVNVPNATTIIIENAERFGLAQLHQLRGRVQRSKMQAYCYLFADIQTEKTKERLQAMEEAADGFALAEKDLEIRGPGALIGKRQSGMADIAMDALENIDLVQAASNAASSVINKDPKLESHQLIKDRVEKLQEQSHFE